MDRGYQGVLVEEGGGDGDGVTGGAGGTGGGGGGSNGQGGTGGYGGGGGGAIDFGGSGGFGGGGGGGGVGDGGFGGGGGSASFSGGTFQSGNGGFGGGGGSGNGGRGPMSYIPGTGGIGGSTGSGTSGGDGAALGGAIFVNTGGVIFGGNCSTSSSSVTSGGTGIAVGSDFFGKSGATLRFSPGIGKTVTLSGTIADDSSHSIPSGSNWTPGTGTGLSLAMQGPGTLVLSGANTYVGLTTISSGVLNLQNSSGLGTGSVSVTGGAQLQLQGGISPANLLSLNGAGGGTGALLNVSGANTYSGAITLGGATTIGSTSGTLTTGTIDGIYALTFAGNGAIALGGPVGGSRAPSSVTVSSGTLTTAGYRVSSTHPLTVGGTLNLTGASTVPSVALSGSGIVNYNSLAAITPSSGTSITASGTGTDRVNINTSVTTSTSGQLGHIGASGAGNSVGTVAVANNSTFTISNTNVYAGAVTVASGSAFNVTGGIVGSNIVATGSAVFSQAGGSVSGLTTSSGTATHSLSGGTLSSATLDGTAALNMSGSSILSTMTLGGSSTLTASAGTVGGGTMSGTNANFVIPPSSSVVLGGDILGGAGVGNVMVQENFAPGGRLGTLGATLKKVEVFDNKTLTMAHDIYATNTYIGSGGSGGTLTTNANNLTLGGALDGSQGLSQKGTLNINNAGFLVSGNIGSNASLAAVNIAPGITFSHNNVMNTQAMSVSGTLKGTGTMNGTVTLLPGGIISPGNSIGTMTVENLVLNSGSTTNIEINAEGESSAIVVTGTAALEGTLQITQDPGNYSIDQTYTILRGTYAGRFSSLEGGFSSSFELLYDPGFIYLHYEAPSRTQISTNFLSGNSANIARYLNANASPSTLAYFTQLSDAETEEAMNAISPSRNGNGTYTAQMNTFSASTALTGHIKHVREQEDKMTALLVDASDRIRAPQGQGKLSGWITGFGEYAHQNGANETPAFHYGSGAVLAGIDYLMGNRGTVGIALGYDYTHFHEESDAGHGNINDYLVSLYGNAYLGNLYLTPAFWGSFSQTHNVRNVVFTGFSQEAKANIYAWQFNPHLEIGYDVQLSRVEISPFTSLDWPISWQRGYTETGASPFNTSQAAQTSSMVRSETGLKFLETWKYTWGAIQMREKASYVFEKPFGTGNIVASFVGTPGAFTVAALTQNLNLGVIAIDFTAIIGKILPVSISLGYQGEFGSNYWSNQMMFTLTKSF